MVLYDQVNNLARAIKESKEYNTNITLNLVRVNKENRVETLFNLINERLDIVEKLNNEFLLREELRNNLYEINFTNNKELTFNI